MADERRVDVDAAEVVEPADGHDTQPVELATHHGHVQRAAAEVEHDQALQRRDLLAEYPHAVRCGRDRLVDQLDRAERGDPRGGEQHLAPLRTPVRRAGQYGRTGRVHTRLECLGDDAA
jgi:hypothetical protein